MNVNGLKNTGWFGNVLLVHRQGHTQLGRRRRRAALRARAALVFGALVFAVASMAVAQALTLHTVRINGLRLPLGAENGWSEEYGHRWETTEVSLLVDGRTYRLTRAELGAHLPMEELKEALERADAMSDTPNVTWTPEVDHTGLLASVFALRERIETDEANHGGSLDGKRLDLHAALKLLKSELPTQARLVVLPRADRIRRESAGESRPGPFAQLLARHTSDYRQSGRSWSRGHNIAQAAKALDGVTIPPHGELSFNEVVGDRSFHRGFMPANEIAGGRVVDGIGGGVCQVATALHAAALNAGFEVLEHYVHSKRPRYAGRGVDSAVAWGLKDLRIRNPFPDPVRIRGDARSGKLSVGLWSGRAPLDVELQTIVQEGSDGARHDPLVIKRTRIVHWPDGPRTDVMFLRYPAEPKD